MDVAGLRAAMNKGEITSLELVQLFGKRCQGLAVDHGLATEENFREAMKLAVACDEETAQARINGTIDQLKPLHGIPFSVKDMFDMKGFLNTYGMAWHGFDVR